MDELVLPATVLSQWTDFELSQFIVLVTCPKFVVFFYFLSHPPRSIPRPDAFAGAIKQTLLIWWNITVQQYLSAVMAVSVPGVVIVLTE